MVGGGRCRQTDDGFFTRERWLFVLFCLFTGYNGITEVLFPHIYCFSFRLKMQRLIIVESIVAVKSLKHQHFVSRGRAAGNVGYREIYIKA